VGEGDFLVAGLVWIGGLGIVASKADALLEGVPEAVPEVVPEATSEP
jgi:hypothetical protein